jgi:hypothetical protein
MGDFDKNTTSNTQDAAAKQKKQMMMVGALGVALLGVVGFQMMKAGPQAASAAGGGGGAGEAIVPTQETPAQALAALDPTRDPTKDLLLRSSALPEQLTQVPRNPFKISDQWRGQLVKPDAVRPPEPVRETTTFVEPVKSPPTQQAKAANVDGLKVAGILKRDGKLFAIINGSIVTVGGTVNGVRVVEIADDRVMVRHIDWPTGPVTTMMIQGRK